MPRCGCALGALTIAALGEVPKKMDGRRRGFMEYLEKYYDGDYLYAFAKGFDSRDRGYNSYGQSAKEVNGFKDGQLVAKAVFEGGLDEQS